MPDTIKNTKQLKLVAGFVDGDDRTIMIDTTKDDITGAQINAIDGNALICDKAGAAFEKWKSAQIVAKKTTKLDLTTA